MVPQLPAGAPTWLLWVLCLLAVMAWAFRETSNRKVANATAQKLKVETQKLKVEMQKVLLDTLAEAADKYEGQIKTIRAVLEADSIRPSPAEIVAVRAALPNRNPEGRVEGDVVAEHLEPRESVRKKLPQVMDQLTEVQRQQMDATRDLSLGVTAGDDVLSDIREKTERVADEVGQLVSLMVRSPRIHIAEGGSSKFPVGAGETLILIPRGSLKGAQGTEGPAG